MSLIPQAYGVGVPEISVPQPEGYQITDLGLMVSNAAATALLIAGILVFAYLVWGGVEWITSGGDKTKVESARGRITAAVIGLAIVAASWALMLLIQYFFGIDIFGTETTIYPGWE